MRPEALRVRVSHLVTGVPQASRLHKEVYSFVACFMLFESNANVSPHASRAC